MKIKCRFAFVPRKALLRAGGMAQTDPIDGRLDILELWVFDCDAPIASAGPQAGETANARCALLRGFQIFRFRLRSVYKELHADRETGC